MISFIYGTFGTAGLVLFLVFLYPEKFEIWASIFWKHIRRFWKGAEKKFIAHDIQGRINEYSKRIKMEVHGFENVGIKLSWIEENETQASFLKDDTLILRVRKSEDENKNFVVASLLFISQVVVRKIKNYLSAIQKESIDLFVARRLFEKEKKEVLDHFIQGFLLVKSEADRRIADYLDNYNIIDKVGIFFPIFIEELSLLGGKVFGAKKDSFIIYEVNEVIDFLKKFSEREIKNRVFQPVFNGKFFHFAIALTMESKKRSKGDVFPCLRHIETLLSNGIESVYLVGPARTENINFMHNLCNAVENRCNLSIIKERKYKAYIKVGDRRMAVDSYLVLLRKKDIEYLVDSEDLGIK